MLKLVSMSSISIHHYFGWNSHMFDERVLLLFGAWGETCARAAILRIALDTLS